MERRVNEAKKGRAKVGGGSLIVGEKDRRLRE